MMNRSFMNHNFRVSIVQHVFLLMFLMKNASLVFASPEQEYLRLKQLRDTNPAAYQNEINQLKQRVRDGIQDIKKQGEEPYREWIQKREEGRAERLKELRRENPSLYQDFAARRRERIENFRQNHPEAFKRFVENHPHAGPRFMNRQNADSRKSESPMPVLQNDPNRVGLHQNPHQERPLPPPKLENHKPIPQGGIARPAANKINVPEDRENSTFAKRSILKERMMVRRERFQNQSREFRPVRPHPEETMRRGPGPKNAEDRENQGKPQSGPVLRQERQRP